MAAARSRTPRTPKNARAYDAQLVPIASLKPYPGNPRRGDVGAIRESLRANGQYRPVVVRRSTRHVLAGNHTLLAAQAEGWEELWATFVDVGAKTAKRIVLVDNRTNDLAGYDDGELAAMLRDVQGVEGTGWSERELVSFLARVDGSPGEDTEPGGVPADPRTKLGDLYVLGEHRLLCGDAFDSASLDRVYTDEVGCVLTDPPYGIDLDTDYSRINGSPRSAPGMRGRGRKHRPVQGDIGAFDASLLAERFDVREQFWFGADYYRRTLSPHDLDGSWLVWDKRTEETDEVVGSGFELIWSKTAHKRDVLRFYWCGAFGAPEARERMHPTQKPVALLAEILTRWAPEACIVADPFAGSGSTLIACENLSRCCYAMEIDPGYCDVIVDRWERHTGRKATRGG